jgi:hypothetical protein
VAIHHDVNEQEVNSNCCHHQQGSEDLFQPLAFLHRNHNYWNNLTSQQTTPTPTHPHTTPTSNFINTCRNLLNQSLSLSLLLPSALFIED